MRGVEEEHREGGKERRGEEREREREPKRGEKEEDDKTEQSVLRQFWHCYQHQRPSTNPEQRLHLRLRKKRGRGSERNTETMAVAKKTSRDPP